MATDNKDSTPDTSAKKKSYHSPELLIYGDIREITKAVGMNGLADGGGGGNMQTRL